MAITLWISLGYVLLITPWFGSGSLPFAWYHLGAFLWKRLTDTDAGKAQRLIVRSQRLLEQARKLTADAQCAAAMVDDEFERRLRLVAGGKDGD